MSQPQPDPKEHETEDPDRRQVVHASRVYWLAESTINASNRAKALIVEQGIVTMQERKGVDAGLNAAALTYVAAAVSTLLTLLYFLWRAGLIGGRR